MQLHKLEFGQETNFSRGKRSRSVMVTSSQDFQRYVSHAKLLPFSKHLQNAAVGGQAASCSGDWSGLVPGMVLRAPCSAFPCRSWAGSILLHSWGSRGIAGVPW